MRLDDRNGGISYRGIDFNVGRGIGRDCLFLRLFRSLLLRLFLWLFLWLLLLAGGLGCLGPIGRILG